VRVTCSEPSSQNDEIFAVDEVHDAVFFGDPPRPGPGEHMPQRFGLANTGCWIAHGLGLSIVAAIAAAHDAKIAAHARPDGGLHIQVSFPASHPIPAVPHTHTSSKTRKILVHRS